MTRNVGESCFANPAPGPCGPRWCGDRTGRRRHGRCRSPEFGRQEQRVGPATTPTSHIEARAGPGGRFRRGADHQLTAALAAAVANPNLGILSGRITDAKTGAPDLGSNARTSRCSGIGEQDSTTAAAPAHPGSQRAGHHDGAGRRQNRMPGVIVLIGGGDPRCQPRRLGGDLVSGAGPDLRIWPTRSAGAGSNRLLCRSMSHCSPVRIWPGWDPADIAGGDIAPIQAGDARRRTDSADHDRVAPLTHAGSRCRPCAGLRSVDLAR